MKKWMNGGLWTNIRKSMKWWFFFFLLSMRNAGRTIYNFMTFIQPIIDTCYRIWEQKKTLSFNQRNHYAFLFRTFTPFSLINSSYFLWVIIIIIKSDGYYLLPNIRTQNKHTKITSIKRRWRRRKIDF